MRLSDIIGIGSEYLKLGVLGVLFLGVLFGIGYGLVYRKLLHGTKRLRGRYLLLAAVCFCYLVVVAGATLLGRGGLYHEVCLYPFYSYREAWYSASSVEWRNIILNICLFLPWGFLLPLWGGRFRKAVWTIGSGVLATLVIEGIQFLSGRGIVEFDDLFNNTLGTVIGFGLVTALLALFSKKDAQPDGTKSRRGWRIVGGLLPCVLTIGAFVILWQLYEWQPYGNLSGRIPNYRVNMGAVEILSDADWKKEHTNALIYKTAIADREGTDALAKELFAARGTRIDESRTDIYDETIIYYSEDHNYSVWIHYAGLTYDLTDFSVFDEEREGLKNADVETVRTAVEELGVDMPKNMEFWEDEEGYYVFQTIENMGGAEELLVGSLRVRLYEDGTIGDVTNYLEHYIACGEEELISEEEAYQKLIAGYFYYPYQMEKIKKFEVKEVSMDYAMDTKGFAQPVYEFLCYINEARVGMYFSIPALP